MGIEDKTYQILFDGVEINDIPDGWDDAKIILERDRAINGLFLKYVTDLVFYGDGYDAIIAKYESNGYCGTINVEIGMRCGGNMTYEKKFTGIIFLRDVEFDENKCSAKCSIEDDTFYGRINSNKNIKATLTSTKSKNGFEITPCPVKSMETFTPSTGAGTTNYNVHDILDALAYLLSFMTDGEINTVVSDWYATQTNEQIGIVSARTLRGGVPLNVPVSFNDLFIDFKTAFNLSFGFEKTASGITQMRIEPIDYYYSSDNGLDLVNINNLSRKIDRTQLYARVLLGSDKTNRYDGIYYNMFNIRFIGFLKEEFQIQSNCNIDSALDLTIKNFIIDHNTIERLIETDPTNTESDLENVWIQYRTSDNHAVKESHISATTPPLYYNQILRNDMISGNYNLQGNIAFYLDDGTSDEVNVVRITNDSSTLSSSSDTDLFNFYSASGFIDPITFTSEVLDPSNNWVTDTYTSPTDGGYSFRVTPHINSVSLGLGSLGGAFTSLQIRIGLKKYDVSNTLIETYESLKNIPGANFDVRFIVTEDGQVYVNNFVLGSYSNSGAWTNGAGIYYTIDFNNINLATGEYVQVVYEYDYTTSFPSVTSSWDFGAGSIFETTAVTNGGGIYATKEPEDYRTSMYSFDYPIVNSQLQSLIENPIKNIQFNNGTNKGSRIGWIDSIEYSIKDGMTNFKLISDK